MALFHNSVAMLEALKACRTPGTAALEASAVEIAPHKMPVPGVTPFAESARAPPPGKPPVMGFWKTGDVLSNPPLKLNAFNVSFDAQI